MGPEASRNWEHLCENLNQFDLAPEVKLEVECCQHRFNGEKSCLLKHIFEAGIAHVEENQEATALSFAEVLEIGYQHITNVADPHWAHAGTPPVWGDRDQVPEPLVLRVGGREDVPFLFARHLAAFRTLKLQNSHFTNDFFHLLDSEEEQEHSATDFCHLLAQLKDISPSDEETMYAVRQGQHNVCGRGIFGLVEAFPTTLEFVDRPQWDWDSTVDPESDAVFALALREKNDVFVVSGRFDGDSGMVRIDTVLMPNPDHMAGNDFAFAVGNLLLPDIDDIRHRTKYPDHRPLATKTTDSFEVQSPGLSEVGSAVGQRAQTPPRSPKEPISIDAVSVKNPFECETGGSADGVRASEALGLPEEIVLHLRGNTRATRVDDLEFALRDIGAVSFGNVVCVSAMGDFVEPETAPPESTRAEEHRSLVR